MIEIERLRGMPVETVFGRKDPRVKITLGLTRQEYLKGLERQIKERDPDDTLIAHLAREIWVSEKSRGQLARELGTTQDVIGAVLTFAGVPYPTHAEANARLMRKPETRENRRRHMVTRWQDPEYSAQMTDHLHHMWDDERRREALGEKVKDLWQDENYRAKRSKSQSSASRRNWTQPGFRENISEKAHQGMLALWQDPEYRKMQSQSHREGWARRVAENPQILEQARENMRQMWLNPDFAELITQTAAITMSIQMQDEKFREASVAASKAKWNNPDFRRRNAAGVRRNWTDLEFRRSIAEASRISRIDPDKISRYIAGGIQGERRDIGFYAQSTWEANFARVLTFLGREFYTREPLRLKVTEEYKPLFNIDETAISVDFVVVTPRGSLVLYEILAWRLDPKAQAKVQMIIDQYPDFRVRPITPQFYRKLENKFKDIIDNDSRFCGWETKKDNLKTNPERYQ